MRRNAPSGDGTAHALVDAVKRYDKGVSGLLLALAVFGVPIIAVAQPSKVRPRQFSIAHAEVRFQCSGPTIEVPAFGRFSSVSSRLVMDPVDLTSASGQVTVDLSSIVTSDLWWDELFRKAAFLELKKYPRSYFKLTRVSGAKSLASGKWTKIVVHGEFTLHGVTNKISAQGMARWWPPRPFRGQVERLAVHLSFPLKWEDYKIDIPKGHPRTFTGDTASVQVVLQYRPTFSAPVDTFRRKTK